MKGLRPKKVSVRVKAYKAPNFKTRIKSVKIKSHKLKP
jgi:hypothetical protein